MGQPVLCCRLASRVPRTPELLGTAASRVLCVETLVQETLLPIVLPVSRDHVPGVHVEAP